MRMFEWYMNRTWPRSTRLESDVERIQLLLRTPCSCCLPSHIHNLNDENLTQRSGIRKWDLWEVINSWEWKPHDGLTALISSLLPVSLHLAIRGYKEVVIKGYKGICKQESRVLPDITSFSILLLDFPSFTTVGNKCWLFKPRSLW